MIEAEESVWNSCAIALLHMQMPPAATLDLSLRQFMYLYQRLAAQRKAEARTARSKGKVAHTPEEVWMYPAAAAARGESVAAAQRQTPLSVIKHILDHVHDYTAKASPQ